MERRDFLTDVARLAALCAVVPNAWRVTSRPRLVDDPFQLGVSCGDPTSGGGVLWTRLAPRPLETPRALPAACPVLSRRCLK